ncbi:MAG: hypothetical protein KJP02_06030 [Octadecabacter sp.]|nr:hypothetical protein [Octadecabacter sp.]
MGDADGAENGDVAINLISKGRYGPALRNPFWSNPQTDIVARRSNNNFGLKAEVRRSLHLWLATRDQADLTAPKANSRLSGGNFSE